MEIRIDKLNREAVTGVRPADPVGSEQVIKACVEAFKAVQDALVKGDLAAFRAALHPNAGGDIARLFEYYRTELPLAGRVLDESSFHCFPQSGLAAGELQPSHVVPTYGAEFGLIGDRWYFIHVTMTAP